MLRTDSTKQLKRLQDRLIMLPARGTVEKIIHHRALVTILACKLTGAVNLKGNFVPGLVVTFAVAAIAGMAVTNITFSGISNLASDTSQNTDAEWIENNLADTIVDKCDNTNKDDPTPLNSNFSHSFDGLKNITGYQTTYSAQGPNIGYRTAVGLDYVGGTTKTAIIEDTTQAGHTCEEFEINGTEEDGTKIPSGRKIELNSTSLKFRVFETSHTSGGYKNITLQVRQD